MRLLLDTHAFVWALTEDPRLGPASRALIETGADDVAVSVVALWEIAIKAALGRMPVSAKRADDAVETSGYRRLSLLPRHIHVLAVLPTRPDHRDPFDRMLIAQARAEGLTLMTNDAKLRAYGVPTIGCA